VLGKSQQLLVVVDQEGTVREVSGATGAIFGWEPKDVVGRKCYRLMNGGTRDASFACSRACPWLVTARKGETSGPTDVAASPGIGSRAGLEFRLTHVPLMGLEPPLIVHLLEDVGRQMHHAGVGARLDSLRMGDPRVAGSLTVREFEVFRLICEGFTSAQIAAQLGLKSTTVRSHTYRIFGKLGARSRAGLLMRFLTDDHAGEGIVVPTQRTRASTPAGGSRRR
jgi:DNA-binding CsgD family transcriptional regulator